MSGAEILAELGLPHNQIVPCGSRVVCDPPVMDTDEDYLVYVHDLDSIGPNFKAAGYEVSINDDDYEPHTTSISSNPDYRFSSWRKGTVNLIVTDSETFFSRHSCATKLCKRLNLSNKQDRIALFQAVLYGK